MEHITFREMQLETELTSIFGSFFIEFFSIIDNMAAMLDLEVVLLISFQVVDKYCLNMIRCVSFLSNDSTEVLTNLLVLFGSFVNDDDVLFRRLLDLSNHTGSGADRERNTLCVVLKSKVVKEKSSLFEICSLLSAIT
jgi:hypothetical protein